MKQLFRFLYPLAITVVASHLFLILYRSVIVVRVYNWAKALPIGADVDWSGLASDIGTWNVIVGVLLVIGMVISCVVIFVSCGSFAILAICCAMKLVDLSCKEKIHRILPYLVLLLYGYESVSLPLHYGHLKGAKDLIFELPMCLFAALVFGVALAIFYVYGREKEGTRH